MAREREEMRGFARWLLGAAAAAVFAGIAVAPLRVASCPGQRSGPARRTPGCAMERLDGLVDDVDVDPPPLVGVANDQAVVAQNVHAARDSPRVGRNPVLRPVAEELEVAAARNTEPDLDIVADQIAR